jgi:hypothetical protein
MNFVPRLEILPPAQLKLWKELSETPKEFVLPTFNSQITLKALSYFDDGNLRQLSDDTKLRLITAPRHVDLEKVSRQAHEDWLAKRGPESKK